MEYVVIGLVLALIVLGMIFYNVVLKLKLKHGKEIDDLKKELVKSTDIIEGYKDKE